MKKKKIRNSIFKQTILFLFVITLFSVNNSFGQFNCSPEEYIVDQNDGYLEGMLGCNDNSQVLMVGVRKNEALYNNTQDEWYFKCYAGVRLQKFNGSTWNFWGDAVFFDGCDEHIRAFSIPYAQLEVGTYRIAYINSTVQTQCYGTPCELYTWHIGNFTISAETRIISLSGNMSFGNVQVGSSSTKTLTITNTGNEPLSVSSISYPTGFSGNWSSGTIATGSSQNVTVTFSPTQAISYSGNITVNSNATSGTNTIAVSGTGTSVPASIISLSGNLAFGNVDVGTTATSTMTISNTGNATLNVSSISYPTGFSGNWSNGSILAGESQDVTVTFAPTQAITYSGNVTVNSDASSGTNTIAISGTGVETTQSITLLTPTLNSVFNVGESMYISWTTSNYSGDIQFQLVEADNTSNIVVNDMGIYNASTGSYNWTVENTVPSGYYKVKAYNTDGVYGDIVDFSDQFAIYNPDITALLLVTKENSVVMEEDIIDGSLTESIINEPLDNTNTIIKMLIIYPPDIDNPDEFETLIQKAVDTTNISFENNEIDLKLQVVGINVLSENPEVNYIENGKFDVFDFFSFYFKLNEFNNISNARDIYSADVVFYISNSDELISWGNDIKGRVKAVYDDDWSFYDNSNFACAVISHQYLPDLTFTHEFGHNLGCRHNIEADATSGNNHGFNSYQGVTPSSVTNATTGAITLLGWRTIMAYQTSTEDDLELQLPFWSNAEREHSYVEFDWGGLMNVEYHPASLGDDINNHNNEQTIQDNMNIIASYRNEDIILKNSGTQDLIITDINIANSWLTIGNIASILNNPIAPGEYVTITPNINWNSLSGDEVTSIEITTNNILSPQTVITITAKSLNSSKSVYPPILCLSNDKFFYSPDEHSIPLFISNVGTGSLEYTIEVKEGNDWITVTENPDELSFVTLSENTSCPRSGLILIKSNTMLNDSIYFPILQSSINITQHPVSLEVEENGTANMSVTAISVFNLGYQWFFNDTILIEGATSSSYSIPNVTIDNVGLYSCEVTNDCDTVKSYNCYLSINNGSSVYDIDNKKLLIYPNPATDLVSLNLNNLPNENFAVRITDCFGRLVVNETYFGGQTIQISTTEYNPGIYFINVSNGNGLNFNNKIIIIK